MRSTWTLVAFVLVGLSSVSGTALAGPFGRMMERRLTPVIDQGIRQTFMLDQLEQLNAEQDRAKAAKQATIKVGDEVMVDSKTASIEVGGKPVATAKAGTIYHVTQVEKDWLWVGSGWIRRSDVLPHQTKSKLDTTIEVLRTGKALLDAVKKTGN